MLASDNIAEQKHAAEKRLAVFAVIKLIYSSNVIFKFPISSNCHTSASAIFAEMFANDDIEGLEKVVHQSTKMIFWTLPRAGIL